MPRRSFAVVVLAAALAGCGLNRVAFHDAYAWLAQKLRIDGARVAGAPTA